MGNFIIKVNIYWILIYIYHTQNFLAIVICCQDNFLDIFTISSVDCMLTKDLFSLTGICINTNIILEIDGFFMFQVLKFKSFMSGAIFPLFAYLPSDLLCSSSDSSALLLNPKVHTGNMCQEICLSLHIQMINE